MCNSECISFVERAIGSGDVKGRDIIEVGSYDVNGSVRPYLQSLAPASYLGVDITPRPGVDLVCDAQRLLAQLGTERFDPAVSTQLLEHGRAWRGGPPGPQRRPPAARRAL